MKIKKTCLRMVSFFMVVCLLRIPFSMSASASCIRSRRLRNKIACTVGIGFIIASSFCLYKFLENRGIIFENKENVGQPENEELHVSEAKKAETHVRKMVNLTVTIPKKDPDKTSFNPMGKEESPQNPVSPNIPIHVKKSSLVRPSLSSMWLKP